MQIDLLAGKYVVAVSGGVDSVVLLHMCTQMINDKRSTIKVLVAHFDHGIRPDSAADCVFVRDLAAKYGLPFFSERAELGAGASEAKARETRYRFLRKIQMQEKADAIVTAHHQDDVLETIIINWMRGTRSRGLSSLRSTPEIRRPLLGMTKQQILNYASRHNLRWREDSTNADETYLRNYVRKHIVTGLSQEEQSRLLAHSNKAAELNDAIGELISGWLTAHTARDWIDRGAYRELPDEVAREVLAEWLRRYTPASITAKTILRIDEAICSGRTGSAVDVAKGYSLKFERGRAILVSHM